MNGNPTFVVLVLFLLRTEAKRASKKETIKRKTHGKISTIYTQLFGYGIVGAALSLPLLFSALFYLLNTQNRRYLKSRCPSRDELWVPCKPKQSQHYENNEVELLSEAHRPELKTNEAER